MTIFGLPDLPFVDALGWMLVHAVWQGAVIAAALWACLHLLRDHAPPTRYVAAVAALALMLVLPVATEVGTSPQQARGPSVSPPPAPVAPVSPTPPTPPAPPASPAGDPPASAAAAETAAAETAAPSPALAWTLASAVASTVSAKLDAHVDAVVASWLRPALPWLVAGWALGVVLLALRLAGGAWHVRRLRRSGRPAPDAWTDRLATLAERLGVRGDVALRVSPQVDGPVVSGWWRPVILVPAGLLTGLPPDQVEALLRHELAHVRRHDVLVGWMQAVVETLLFFHPAAWWVSQQIRHERERCCDDLAVGAGTDRCVYARALTSVAEQQMRAPLAYAASDGALLARIRRLVAPPRPPSDSRVSMVVAGLMLLVLPIGLAACASQERATQERATQGEAAETRPAAVTVPKEPTASDEPSASDEPTVPAAPEVEVDVRDDVIVLRRGRQAARVDTTRPPGEMRPWFEFEHDDGQFRFRTHPDSAWQTSPLPTPDRLMQRFAFRFDSLGTYAFAFDVDSLMQEHEGFVLRADSLARHVERHVSVYADSLAREARRMEERMREREPERLRDRAQRLRDEAERMEERARELEAEQDSGNGG